MALVSPATFSGASEYDRYGGWRKLKGKKTGFFHTEKIRGRWWFVTPDGNAFISKGIDTITPGGARGAAQDPAVQAQWVKNTAQQLRDWNFNTIGAWSNAGLFKADLPYTLIVGTGSRRRGAQGAASNASPVTDYFSEEFLTAADQAAKRACESRAGDPWLLGYFTDNELNWTHNKISWKGPTPWDLPDSMLETYLKMPASSAGFKKADEFMKTRGLIPGAVTEDDMAGFEEIVMAQYARVSREAIRRYDKNHLVLGCRFAGHAPEPVLRGLAPYFDVVSFNHYGPHPPAWKMKQIGDVTGRPFMITEFSFKAMDSGLPNTRGAGLPLATQQDRADGFATYIDDLASLPGAIGYHWFEFRDQPPEGRGGDGENSNFGVVKSDSSVWEVLTRRMTQVNLGMEARALKNAQQR
jgi:agarase